MESMFKEKVENPLFIWKIVSFAWKSCFCVMINFDLQHSTGLEQRCFLTGCLKLCVCVCVFG